MSEKSHDTIYIYIYIYIYLYTYIFIYIYRWRCWRSRGTTGDYGNLAGGREGYGGLRQFRWRFGRSRGDYGGYGNLDGGVGGRAGTSVGLQRFRFMMFWARKVVPPDKWKKYEKYCKIMVLDSVKK